MSSDIIQPFPGTSAAPTVTLPEQQLRELLARIQPAKPWYREYPLFVSILAFLLSLTTSCISIWTSMQKDVHEQQAQLATIMQNLNELTIKQREYVKNNKNSDLYTAQFMI